MKNKIPIELIRRYKIFPFYDNNELIKIFYFETLSKNIINELEFITNCKIQVVNKSKSEILELIEETYGIEKNINEIVSNDKNFSSIDNNLHSHASPVSLPFLISSP